MLRKFFLAVHLLAFLGVIAGIIGLNLGLPYFFELHKFAGGMFILLCLIHALWHYKIIVRILSSKQN